MAVSARVVNVGLSPANERNLAPSCQRVMSGLWGTAGVKPEEGGDNVKSSRPLRPGRHTCYNAWYSASRTREGANR